VAIFCIEFHRTLPRDVGNRDRNSITPRSKSVILAYRGFIKIALDQQIFVTNVYGEFFENSNGLVAASWQVTLTWSAHRSYFPPKQTSKNRMLIQIPSRTMYTLDITPVIKIYDRKHNIFSGFLKIKMLQFYSKITVNIGKRWHPIK
jgi:hypothetical protein